MANAPGKSHRKGLTLLEVADMFPTEEKSRAWIEEMRWPEGPYCPHCGSFNVQANIRHKTATHRCRECPDKPMFTVRIGTIMQETRLKYRIWAIGLYLYTTNIKGVSSMRMHRELGITQKSAWFLMHRLRKAGETTEAFFSGPVEADESYFGGKRKNMSNAKRKELKDTGRGAVGKAAVVAVKDRETNTVVGAHLEKTDAIHVAGYVATMTTAGSKVYTDDAKAYNILDSYYDHESVNHSVGEYVRDQAHTNGVESFWSMMKRGYIGIYHKISHKHLDKYVSELAHRHNIREQDTINQMKDVLRKMVGKRLTYDQLTENNGQSSGARG